MADNFFTRASIGGIPNYVWLVGGGAALLIWRQRSSSSGSSSSSQAAQQQAQLAAQLEQEQAAMAAYPQTGGASGQPVVVIGGDGSGQPGATTPAQTGASGPPASPNLYAGTVGTAAGDFSQVPNAAENHALLSAGVTQYEQVAPGDFVPVTATLGSGAGKYAAGSSIGGPLTYILNPN